MKKTIHSIITLYLIVQSIFCFGQIDTTSLQLSRYQLHDKYPFYHKCTNCKVQDNRPRLLCGHSYNTLTTGYTYDGDHWAELGYAIDNTSCFPEKGNNYFSSTYSLRIGHNFMNGLKLSYLRDNLFGVQFYYFKYGASIETITDFSNYDLIIRPEIRLSDNMDYSGILKRINISYGYNFYLTDNLLGLNRSHQITIIFNIIQKGWIS